MSGFVGATNGYAFDITDPANAVLLSGFVVTNTGGGTNAYVLGDYSVATSRYAVCQSNGIRNVVSVQRCFFRGLVTTNRQADYVVICPYAFRQQVYRLLALRYRQGLSVAVAPLPDIYNEFSYGIADPGAIKQFIGYAYHHWQAAPRYVLLAGSGTFDPLLRESDSSMPDIIPVHLGAGYANWAALDGWYANVNSQDGATGNVPNVAIGRIPVQTASQLSNVVNKIMMFEGVPTNNDSRGYALLVYDNYKDGNDFGAATGEISANDLVPNDILPTLLSPSQCPGEFIQDFNAVSGVFIVNYFGHGAVDRWGASLLFGASDISSLTNSYYPILSSLTCQTGGFQSSNQKCLIQLFLDGANRGAVACLASSGTTSLPGSVHLAHGFYQGLLATKQKRIGDAMMSAYQHLFDMSANTRELLLFELFGDPAMIVNP